MRTHPYLRAYMAGITAPTMFLLVIMTAFVIAESKHVVPAPVERIIVFPMAVVPSAWGLWNILYVRLRGRLSVGLHGALLPLLLTPSGFALARSFGLDFLTPGMVASGLPAAMLVYYLAWKYLVGFFNELLGID